MDLTLARKQLREDGVFSELAGPGLSLTTLEHAYGEGEAWSPKIPNGVYTCIRGKHRLHGMTEDFETFEITGVDGHSNLLFHWGNWNRDSDGCVLTGEAIAQSSSGQMVTNSKEAFHAFMAAQEGLDSFPLTVE